MRQTERLRAAALLALALLLSGGCATNPVTGKSQVVLVSEEQEVAQGNQFLPIATQMSEGETPHSEIQRLVQDVGLKMARASERPHLPWQFNVVDANEPNAYALPGGKISVTRGLVARLDSEDQLAAILGHEIGHVTARHSAVSQSRDSLLGALLGVGGAVAQARGGVGAGAILTAGQVGAALLTTKYSRDQERQADELGLRYMTGAGYNPRGFLQVMEVLQTASQREPGAFDALFASHPMTSERVETARQRLSGGYAGEQRRAADSARFSRAVAPLKQEAPAFALADEAKKLARNNQLPAAAERFERAVQMVPRSPILNALWADALYELRDYRRAKETARRASGLYYGSLVEGAANWRLRDFRASLAALDAADRLVPGTLLVSYFRGRNLEDLGDRPAAAAEYAKVARATQGRGEYGGYALARLREWGLAS